MAGSVDGYAWLMNDGPTTKREYKSLPYANIDGNPGGPGATLVVRMKTLFRFGYNNENLGLLEGDGLSTSFHWSGEGDTIYNYQNGLPGMLNGLRANDQSYTFTGMSTDWYADWHIIRLVTKRNASGTVDVKVYFDEAATPLLQYTKARDKVDPDAFFFGTGSTAGQQSVMFDGLVATDGGGYAPGENAAFDAVVAATAPEPGAILLLLSGMPLSLRRRRRA